MNYKHGHKSSKDNGLGSPEYIVWKNMAVRCYNPKNTSYHNYGGRGISVCARWRKFVNFLADMGPRPEGAQLERKNNNGNYTKQNCVWVTPQHQANNRRSNVFASYQGRRGTIADLARAFGVKYTTMYARIKRSQSEYR